MTRKLLPFLLALVLIALPALAQVSPGMPIAFPERNFSPRYSPDGESIAYLRGGEPQRAKELWVRKNTGENSGLVICNPERKKTDVAMSSAPILSSIRQYEWMPDSKSIICVTGTMEDRRPHTYVSLITSIYGDRSTPIRLAADGATFTGFSIAPSGKAAAFFFRTKYFLVPLDAKVGDRKEIQPIDIPDLECSAPSWGADGRIYFTATAAREKNPPAEIYAIEADGKITQITATKDAGETFPSLSPDGKTLAFLRDGILVLRNLANGEEKTTQAGLYRWLPDGRIVASVCEVSAARADVQWGAFPSIAPPVPEYQTLLSERKSIRLLSSDGGTVMALLKEETLSLAPAQENPFPINIPQTAIAKDSIACLLPLPDISPAGKIYVYEKDGALYLNTLPEKPVL